MKVESVKQRINNQAVQQLYQQYKPNFTARVQIPERAVDINLKNEIKAFMPPSIKGMKKFSDNMGEVQNIIINALGTGLVAPIFIKWNPLSKTDEDTRTYSAWRQPVSAVIAVLTQVGATIPFNRMVDRLANNGYYDEKYNKTLFQDKSYIEKITKRLYPFASKEQIANMVQAKMKEQQTNLINMIKRDNIVMSRDNGETFKMSEDGYKNLLNEVLDEHLESANKEVTKCLETTIPKKTKRAEYYRTNKDEALKIFNDLNKLVDETPNPKGIKKHVKDLKKQYKNSDPELQAIFDDILDRRGNNPEDLRIAVKAKLTGILRDIDFYTTKNNFSTKEELAKFVKNYENENRLAPLEDEIKVLNEMKKMVKSHAPMTSIENYIENEVKKNPDHRLSKFKFSKEIAEHLQEQIKNNIKAHKQLTGLRVSLLILPLSCWVLNWTYPRFMDALFPNLSNKKHPKEIKELVNKANHQTEVKS